MSAVLREIKDRRSEQPVDFPQRSEPDTLRIASPFFQTLAEDSFISITFLSCHNLSRTCSISMGPSRRIAS